NYGWNDSSRVSIHTGTNSRLDELQAAVLNVLLPHLEEGNSERLAVAAEYRRHLQGVEGLGLPAQDPGAVYHQFAVVVERERDGIRNLLAKRGIGTGVHYSLPLHRQPAFEQFCASPLPVTENLSAQLISLPVQPEVVSGRVPSIASAL